MGCKGLYIDLNFLIMYKVIFLIFIFRFVLMYLFIFVKILDIKFLEKMFRSLNFFFNIYIFLF